MNGIQYKVNASTKTWMDIQAIIQLSLYSKHILAEHFLLGRGLGCIRKKQSKRWTLDVGVSKCLNKFSNIFSVLSFSL
jgi:hypothetical protein